MWAPRSLPRARGPRSLCDFCICTYFPPEGSSGSLRRFPARVRSTCWRAVTSLASPSCRDKVPRSSPQTPCHAAFPARRRHRGPRGSWGFGEVGRGPCCHRHTSRAGGSPSKGQQRKAPNHKRWLGERTRARAGKASLVPPAALQSGLLAAEQKASWEPHEASPASQPPHAGSAAGP